MQLKTCLFVVFLATFATAGTLRKTDNNPPRGSKDYFRMLKGDFETLNPSVGPNGRNFYESDIVLTDEQLQAMMLRKAVQDTTILWLSEGPDGFPLIPYRFGDANVDQNAVEAGLTHWEENTCLNFEFTNQTDIPHLEFILGSGCWSYVGQVFSTAQQVSIGEGCNSLSTVAHEIGHAMGFQHEQSRSDRDSYITILPENIIDSAEGNFARKNTNHHGVPYDLTSVLHYYDRAFTIDGSVTIATLDPIFQNFAGERLGLTHYDLLLINKVYPCIEKWLVACNMTSDPCLNNGYTGKDCSCICPRGTLGANCEVEDRGYYDDLISEYTEYIVDSGTITTPNYPSPYPADFRMVKIILAPECHTVHLIFNSFQIYGRNNYCNSQSCCYFEILEIRTSDPIRGDVYCDTDIKPGDEFESTKEMDRMILYFVSRTSWNTGWSANVTFNPIPGCGSFPTPTPVDCNIEVISSSETKWTSPLFGEANYPNGATCTMNHTSTSPSWAQIHFNSFSLQEPGSNSLCTDQVSFSRPHLLGDVEFCGIRTSMFSLPSSNFVAEFVADGAINAPGFDITITKETSSCHLLIETGGVGDEGIIETPKAANNLWETKACEWWIISPEGTRIQLTSERIKFGKCSDTTVIVDSSGDVYYPEATSELYCGRFTLSKTSEANQMNVLFYSVSSKKNLKATWTVVSA